jgi:serine/threonine protein phosphatase 1
MGRLIAIGDIHGSITRLNALIRKLELSKSDKLVFLGDYVDRGEDPKAVVEALIKLCDEFDVTPLKGNHEQMFLDFLSDPVLNYRLFVSNGGHATLNSYGDDSVPEHHLEFLKGLKVSYETPEYYFVHAGVNPVFRLDDQIEDDLLWIRDEFIDCDFNFGKKVIFGHSRVAEPLVHSNKIGIDTGAYKREGRLTAVILPEEVFVQV